MCREIFGSDHRALSVDDSRSGSWLRKKGPIPHRNSCDQHQSVCHGLRYSSPSSEKGSADPLPYVGVAAWIKKSDSRTAIFRTISGPQRDQFDTLPESKKEVEAIAGSLPKPSTLLLGGDATETHFKNLPLDNYNVIHLALHGYVDEDYPDRSALVFAPQKEPTDDGLLQVREIRNLHLNAQLVTLSACNSGVGPVSEDGVANLMNAFIEAGADTVVSTLWELEDHSTEHLMADFYEHLAQKQPKVAALRQAQLDLIHEGFSPYFWASFELAGDPNGTL
jgi:CHAT domain-containing protein